MNQFTSDVPAHISGSKDRYAAPAHLHMLEIKDRLIY
jgi:hypothetical protein